MVSNSAHSYISLLDFVLLVAWMIGSCWSLVGLQSKSKAPKWWQYQGWRCMSFESAIPFFCILEYDAGFFWVGLLVPLISIGLFPSAKSTDANIFRGEIPNKQWSDQRYRLQKKNHQTSFILLAPSSQGIIFHFFLPCCKGWVMFYDLQDTPHRKHQERWLHFN